MKELSSIQVNFLRPVWAPRDETLEYICRCTNIGVNGFKLWTVLVKYIILCIFLCVLLWWILLFIFSEINLFNPNENQLLYTSLISGLLGIPIGYRIGKYAQTLVKEIAKCPKCQETTLNLTKEDIVTENTIRNIEGQGKNRKAVHYRVGNKTAFFQCGSCGYEDSLNTPYKEKIY